MENGIWLCQTCAKLIDNDPTHYPAELLESWKSEAESAARRALENRPSNLKEPPGAYRKVEGLMPQLFAEMRKDLADRPLSREFVILKRSWKYWARGHELVYYFDDHPELPNKLHILENADMVSNIAYDSVGRYLMSEELVAYLTSGPPADQGMEPTAQKPGG